MTCFCTAKTAPLVNLKASATANLSVSAVPPQMPSLVAMLALSEETATPAAGTASARADLKLAAVLAPIQNQPWAFAQPSMLMKMTAQMSSVAGMFPMDDVNALMAEIQQAIASLQSHVLPAMSSAAKMPKAPMANMVAAARMTLSMRAKGLCPMALSNVDQSFATAQSLSAAAPTLNATVNASAQMQAKAAIPPFALKPPQVSLALSLAALAPLADPPPSIALPQVGSTDYAAAAMAALAKLAQIPPLPLDAGPLLAQLASLSDMAAIQQAFGPDAMTPAGVTRVQAMLNYMARVSLPAMPSASMSMQAKMDMLPTVEAVQTGAQVAKMSAAMHATMQKMTPRRPQALSALNALNAVKAVLADYLGVELTSGCAACQFTA